MTSPAFAHYFLNVTGTKICRTCGLMPLDEFDAAESVCIAAILDAVLDKATVSVIARPLTARISIPARDVFDDPYNYGIAMQQLAATERWNAAFDAVLDALEALDLPEGVEVDDVREDEDFLSVVEEVYTLG